jgi:hypothetical protein
MKVEMENDLPSPSLYVKDQFIPRICNGMLLRHLFRLQDHFKKDVFIFLRQIIDAPDMLSGNDEKMDGRMGTDVFEHNQRFSLIDEIG